MAGTGGRPSKSSGAGNSLQAASPGGYGWRARPPISLFERSYRPGHCRSAGARLLTPISGYSTVAGALGVAHRSACLRRRNRKMHRPPIAPFHPQVRRRPGHSPGQNIASTNRRLSAPPRPRSPFLPGRSCAIRPTARQSAFPCPRSPRSSISNPISGRQGIPQNEGAFYRRDSVAHRAAAVIRSTAPRTADRRCGASSAGSTGARPSSPLRCGRANPTAGRPAAGRRR